PFPPRNRAAGLSTFDEIRPPLEPIPMKGAKALAERPARLKASRYTEMENAVNLPSDYAGKKDGDPRIADFTRWNHAYRSRRRRRSAIHPDRRDTDESSNRPMYGGGRQARPPAGRRRRVLIHAAIWKA